MFVACVQGSGSLVDLVEKLQNLRHGNVENYQRAELNAKLNNRLSYNEKLAGQIRKCKNLSQCRKIHARVMEGSLDRFISNLLIDMYGKFKSLKEARFAFDNILEKNEFSWNILIAAYVRDDKYRKALWTFWEMQMEGFKPDKFTLSTVIVACTRLGALEHGKTVHKIFISCCQSQCDAAVLNALIHFYGNSGNLRAARNVFEEMIIQRDVVSWTSLIAVNAQLGHPHSAVELFRQMQLEGELPDSITVVNVLHACSHGGLLKDGGMIFSSLQGGDYKMKRSMAHFGCMIDLAGRAGMLREAEELAEQTGDLIAWSSVLSACKIHGDVKRGTRAAKNMKRLDRSDYQQVV